jgi:16S rRNA (cytosine1402-N4)-methyltransferase
VKDEESKTDASSGGRHGEEKIINHVPVLLETAIDFLAVRRGGTYIDATVGLGGHSFEIAKHLGAKGNLWGFDKDPAALARTGERLRHPPAGLEAEWPQVKLVHASFAEIGNYVDAGAADGVLADLGVSSLQLEDAARGFSFQAEGPLDMRMDSQGGSDADQVVNHLSERELADVIYEFGEERRSRRIARAICRARPIRNTTQLAAVVSAAARPMKSERLRHQLHPATRTFQAIRIFVNRELDDLRALFAPNAAPQILKPGGRLVVISFHSLEDRVVKESLREGVRLGQWQTLTRKPLMASVEEISLNPRARSAKLRAAERVSH